MRNRRRRDTQTHTSTQEEQKDKDREKMENVSRQTCALGASDGNETKRAASTAGMDKAR